MTVLRHKISNNLLIGMNGMGNVEKTCCGLAIELNSISFPVSATYVGEYNCKDCKEAYPLEMLARLP